LSAAWNASGNNLAPDNNGFKRRDATLIALATAVDTSVPQLANHTVFVPEAPTEDRQLATNDFSPPSKILSDCL
jgi:hypothetical protein